MSGANESMVVKTTLFAYFVLGSVRCWWCLAVLGVMGRGSGDVSCVLEAVCWVLGAFGRRFFQACLARVIFSL